MSDKKNIVFSPIAKQRLESIANYLLHQHLSASFVIEYLNGIEHWLETVLFLFLQSGTPAPKYGSGVRKIVYKKYNFIYRVQGQEIQILTIYRENLP